MTMFSVRQAVLADLDVLVPLFDAYRQFYGRASDPQGARDFLRARFEHGESTLLLAHEGSTARGFTQLYPSFSSTAMARIYVLNDLFVDPKGRRRGVGAALLEAAASYAQKLGAVRLALSTATSNAQAQALYESKGWKRDEQFYVYQLALAG